jgi:hypothetical protein
MHRCLEMDDIVRLIAKETVTLEVPSAISLACTRKAVEAAVMEILWSSHQDDLVNLVRCFPTEVWEIRESDSGKLYFVWAFSCHQIHADLSLFGRLIGL